MQRSLEGDRVLLLGQTTAYIGGERRELAGKAALVMCRLVVAQGMAVSAETLRDDVWGRTVSRGTVKTTVARLRQLLGPRREAIATVSIGYRYDSDVLPVDVLVFEALARKAERAFAVERESSFELFSRALAVWGGRPYGELEAPFLDLERHHLEQRRLEVVERVAAGAEGGLLSVDELVSLSRANPGREQLALSAAGRLQGAGRVPEALGLLRDHRRAVRELFGLDPSAAVSSLELELLEPSELDTTRGVARSGSHPTCVGRDVEIDWLRAAIGVARRGGCVVLEGEPGVGKSTLLDAALGPSGRSGIVCVACDREPERPMAPVVEMFEHLARRSALASSTLSSEVVGLLSRLSPELAGLFGGVRAEVLQDRSKLVSDLADGLARSRLDVLIVDDIQWADELTVEVIIGLLAGTDSPNVVLSTRSSERANVQRILANASNPDVLVLDGLDDDAVIALARSLDNDADRELLVDLGHRAGGNPLFLLSLLEQGWPHVDVVPETISETLAAQLATVPGASRTVLNVAALIGTQFGLDLLDLITPGAKRDLLPALAAHVVDIETSSGSFRHELMREVVVNGIPEGRRAELHERIADALEAAGGTPHDIARHRLGAAVLDPIAAARALHVSAESHMEVFDYERAIANWRQGLELLDGLIGAEFEVGEVLIALGHAKRLASIAGHSQTLLSAAQHAERHQLDEHYVRAVAELCDAGETTAATTAVAQTLPMLDRALTLDVSVGAAASLRLGATMALTVAGQPQRARSLYLEGAELARRSGNDRLIEQSLLVAYTGLPDPDDLDLLQQAAAGARRMAIEFPRLRWTAAHYDLVTGIITAQRSVVDQAIAELRDALTVSPEPVRAYGLAAWEAAVAHLHGDLDRAESELDRAAKLGEAAYPSGWVRANHLSLLLAIRLDQGRGTELAGSLSTIGQSRGGIPAFIAADAYLSLLSGDEDGAESALASVLVKGVDVIPRNHLWTMTIYFASLVAAHLQVAPVLGELIEELVPHSGRMVWNGNACLGPIDRSLGVLYGAIDDHDRAERHLKHARDLCRQLGAKLMLESMTDRS